MASNTFGQHFRITTWGESHGKAIGVVVDGCPAGLPLDEEDIQQALARRTPGQNAYTSPRSEKDVAEIYSGVFEGKTTGAPISIIIFNHDVDSKPYDEMRTVLRPGHATFAYQAKYGTVDHRGGGRSSARETACRVAAGAIAQKILAHFNIHVQAYLHAVGEYTTGEEEKMDIAPETLFCSDSRFLEQIKIALQETMARGDSLGGVVGFYIQGLPAGLGDPVYEKIEANLAKAMLTLPATKGFEIGQGFNAARMTGETHNDLFKMDEGRVKTHTNHAGGTLGGITTGMPLYGRVAFKPTSSIKKPQATITQEGLDAVFQFNENAKHDPCVAIRAVPVVEAMCAIVVVDALLMNRLAKLE